MKILTVAGSAGSLLILKNIISALKSKLVMPLVVVVHRYKAGGDELVQIMQKYTQINVCEPEHGQSIEANMIYIAPANYHLFLEPDYTFGLSVDTAVNYARPSIDLWLNSCAEVCSSESLVVMLSGANADGAKGCLQIKEAGGEVIVQDCLTAEYPAMPQSVIDIGAAEKSLQEDDIIKYVSSTVCENAR